MKFLKILGWIAGFLLTFGMAFMFMLVYAVSQPSMWLPVLFGIAFWGLLSFSPKVDPWTRFGLSMLFTAGSCMLWMASGSSVFLRHSTTFTLAFKMLLGIGCGIGLLIGVVAFARAPAKQRPSLLPLLTLMALGWLISYFSSSHGGASPMVDWVVRHLGLSRDSAETLVVVVRKTIHFSFYGLVAVMGYIAALRNGAHRNSLNFSAFATTFAFACFDEVRQSTQIDRGGSALDVLLDMAGAVAAVLLIAALQRSKGGRSPKSARNSSTL